MRKWLCAVFLVMCAASSVNADPVAQGYVGAGAAWYDGSLGLPDDFEIGGNGSASLSPHISLVGGAYYGVDKSYIRGYIGPRFTITDASDPNFSIGIGIERQLSSKPELRPEEFVATSNLGFRPWPQDVPNLILAVQGAYGLKSQQAYLTAGVRLHVWSSK